MRMTSTVATSAWRRPTVPVIVNLPHWRSSNVSIIIWCKLTNPTLWGLPADWALTRKKLKTLFPTLTKITIWYLKHISKETGAISPLRPYNHIDIGHRLVIIIKKLSICQIWVIAQMGHKLSIFEGAMLLTASWDRLKIKEANIQNAKLLVSKTNMALMEYLPCSVQ